MLAQETGAAAKFTNGQAVDTKTVAEYLGLSRYTLECWRYRGGGPKYVKFGRAVRYRQSDLDAFIAQGVRSNTSEGAE